MSKKIEEFRSMTKDDKKTLKWIAQTLANSEPLTNQKAGNAGVSGPPEKSNAGLLKSEVKEVVDSIAAIFERLEKQESVSWKEFSEVKMKALTLIEKIESENSTLPEIER